MPEEMNIKEQINSVYFWDVDYKKLNAETSKQLIITRVFSLGEIKEMNDVIKYYGKDQTLNILYNINSLDPKTFNFIVKYFNVPKTKFRCYNRKQSKNQHWI